MRQLPFWKAVVADRANMLDDLVRMLEAEQVSYCVIGGQAVNAYVEPLVSLDLDLVIALDDLKRIEPLLREHFRVETFPHSINLSLPDSDLRVQIQTDSRYSDFIRRATRRNVLGVELSVATLGDVLTGKVWAALDSQRRASKRQKDLADIARILEARPELRSEVPDEVLQKLM